MKEVVKKQETTLAVGHEMMDMGSPLSQGDIIIPKLWLMQKLSDMVDAGAAKEGDYVDSVSGEVVGSIDSPVELIPFFMEKIWYISEQQGQNYKLVSVEEENTSNQNLKYMEKRDGRTYKNERHMRFYCINPNDPTLPVIITFKNRAIKNGQALATQMYIKNRAAKKLPVAYTILLGATKAENNEGKKFCIPAWSLGRDSTPEEINSAVEWFNIIRSGSSVKVDERDETSKTPSAPYADEEGMKF